MKQQQLVLLQSKLLVSFRIETGSAITVQKQWRTHTECLHLDHRFELSIV